MIDRPAEPSSHDSLLATLNCPTHQRPRIWAFTEPCPSTDELKRVFSMTNTQALVAQLLVARRTNAEIAQMLG